MFVLNRHSECEASHTALGIKLSLRAQWSLLLIKLGINFQSMAYYETVRLECSRLGTLFKATCSWRILLTSYIVCKFLERKLF